MLQDWISPANFKTGCQVWLPHRNNHKKRVTWIIAWNCDCNLKELCLLTFMVFQDCSQMTGSTWSGTIIDQGFFTPNGDQKSLLWRLFALWVFDQMVNHEEGGWIGSSVMPVLPSKSCWRQLPCEIAYPLPLILHASGGSSYNLAQKWKQTPRRQLLHCPGMAMHLRNPQYAFFTKSWQTRREGSEFPWWLAHMIDQSREWEMQGEIGHPIKTGLSSVPSCFNSNTNGKGVTITRAQEPNVAVMTCIGNSVDTRSKYSSDLSPVWSRCSLERCFQPFSS